MADFNIAQSATSPRSFTQTSNTQDDRNFYVINPSTFAPNVYSGVYLVDFAGPSANGVIGSGGNDSLVLRLSDFSNWFESGELLRPLAFPMFYPAGSSSDLVNFDLVLPNRHVVNGVKQADLTIAIRNFDLQNDQVVLEVISDANGFAPNPNTLATLILQQESLGDGSATLGVERWEGTLASIFENTDDRWFLGSLTVFDSSEVGALERDITNRLAQESYRFGSGSDITALALEIEFPIGSEAVNGPNQLLLPKFIDREGQSVPDIDWVVILDPINSANVALTLVNGEQEWSDDIDYTIIGIGSNGSPALVTPLPNSTVGLRAYFGTHDFSGLEYDLKVVRPEKSCVPK